MLKKPGILVLGADGFNAAVQPWSGESGSTFRYRPCLYASYLSVQLFISLRVFLQSLGSESGLALGLNATRTRTLTR